MIEGNPVKYGAPTLLRFEIPESWDRSDLTEIDVEIKNTAGSDLISGTATIASSTTLAAACGAEDVSITLAVGAPSLEPGDRLWICGDGEIAEVREVYSYDSDSRTVVVRPELEHPHASGASVLPMWAVFGMDLSDTGVYVKGMDLFVHWIPDTENLESVDQYIIGVTGFSSGAIWDDFKTLYPTEWESIHGRDLIRLEHMSRDMLRMEFQRRGLDINKIQNSDILQPGMIRMLRLMILEASGDSDELEYNRAKDLFHIWADGIAALPLWEDKDQDQAADENEIQVHSFCATRRYF